MKRPNYAACELLGGFIRTCREYETVSGRDAAESQSEWQNMVVRKSEEVSQ